MRQIQSTYYGPDKKEVQINLAKHERSAVMRAIDHMSLNHYGAAVCEVFDTNTAQLHAVITRNFNGKITLAFLRDPCREAV